MANKVTFWKAFADPAGKAEYYRTDISGIKTTESGSCVALDTDGKHTDLVSKLNGADTTAIPACIDKGEYPTTAQ